MGDEREWRQLVEGRSAVAEELREQIAACARAPDEPVLVLGPTGSGKERVMLAIHQASRPTNSPCEPFVCANQTTDLFESALFGFERGAFTGATEARTGACDHAETGSLLLDEIGDTPLPLQPKLLRVLESRRYRPVGGRCDRELRARVIAATHVDLTTAMREGRFRSDLFYRVSQMVVRVPGLDERRADIPDILQSITIGRMSELFDGKAVDYLIARDWPGHVRELKGFVARALATIQRRPITREDLVRLEPLSRPTNMSSQVTAFLLQQRATWTQVEECEREYLALVLKREAGNVSAAARSLGIPREKLRSMLGNVKKQ